MGPSGASEAPAVAVGTEVALAVATGAGLGLAGFATAVATGAGLGLVDADDERVVPFALHADRHPETRT
jgi:hypothetical protein